MSLSASDNGFRAPSGKTPPPAPSAAYARRATQVDGLPGARYRPPALRAIASGGSPSEDAPPQSDRSAPPSNYPPGFRRARAGTLPSNVQLAAQNYAAASSGLSSTPQSTDSLLDYVQTPLNSALPTGQPMRPNLRHAASIASSAAASERTANSRLRSGSLTLPPGGLNNNAFGSSVFSSNWLSSASGNFPALDEMRSIASMDSAQDEYGDVHTLDYLGLDEHRPATISEARALAQAAVAGNLANPARLRASTVSHPYRMRNPAVNSLLASANTQEEEEYIDEYDMGSYQQLSDPYGNAGPYGTGAQDPYVAKGFKHTQHLTAPTSRPRATSVGILDDASRSLQRRSSTNELQNYQGDTGPTLASASSLSNLANMLKAESKPAVRGGPTSPSVRFPNSEPTYMQAPSHQNRTVSPKAENTQVQAPTRSLWIGNLDSSVTSEQLIHVFAPYGAIESLRLLPEKECGFVNFVDQADAIRAKEDVLNRLGGNIGMPNGQVVRIGFGKADSAPVAPAKAGVTSPQSTAPATPVGKSPSGGSIASGMPAGIEAQLQSTPTRALWIGSIPSTTTPATLLSVFSPFGPIESARVLTHKNCGFINFERLDDAVRARKALNGRDVLGSDVGAIRIGFARVPVKNGADGSAEEGAPVSVQGVGDLSLGATIHALRSVKGASTIPAEQQVLSGGVENYRSNLLLSMIGSGLHNSAYISDGTPKPASWVPSVTEQQMIMKQFCIGVPDAEAAADIQALAEFRPPTMYYTTIPLVSERPHNRRWDAAKLRELRKKLDSGNMSTEEIDEVVADFLDGEIVDLASDWLGNTVVQKLFERCSPVPRFAMLERIAPHLAMIGIHKNGTWAAQKIIECVQTHEEISLIAQNLRPYAPPLLLDQFGNYVVQCCLRFGPPADDFIFDAIVDRLWEVAQGRFGARSMRACLESPHITVSQQRRFATAIVLNSIPLATNPNGALLLTWLLDSSNFSSRYSLLAPRFTPHLSHLCTHKLASLTVLRIVNQKIEPAASLQIVRGLFFSTGDHVLTDVLGDQVNGVAVVHKILTSPFIELSERDSYLEATKRVLIELKVIATQAYRRLIEEVGLPIPNLQPTYNGNAPQPVGKRDSHALPGMPNAYNSNDQGLASMMAALQMGGQNPHSGPPQLQIDPGYGQAPAQPGAGSQNRQRGGNPAAQTFSPQLQQQQQQQAQHFNPFSSPEMGSPRGGGPRRTVGLPPGPPPPGPAMSPPPMHPYGTQSPIQQPTPLVAMGQYGAPMAQPQSIPPHMYQPYMYQMYGQNPPNVGTYHT